MKVEKFKIDLKTIFAALSIGWAGVSQISAIKSELSAQKKDIQEIKEERLRDIVMKIEESDNIYQQNFQEYKVRTNEKMDDVSKKLYELNGMIQVCEKLGKKNSRFMDVQVEDLIRKNKCSCSR